MKIKLLGSEAACATSTGNGSNFGLSSAVRLHNSGSTARLVTVETSANATIGTFTLGVGSSEVFKEPYRRSIRCTCRSTWCRCCTNKM